MIQSNELRIGNLVISNGQVYDIRCGEDIDWLSFEPIPLTEEFLFKFGFTQCFPFHVPTMTGLNGYFTLNDIDISYNDYGHWDCRLNSEYEHYVQLKHVHTLQNLYFALTGSELVLSTVPEATKPAL